MEFLHYPVKAGEGIGTRTQRLWMSGLVFLQAVLTVARVVYLYQALGGFFLGLIVILGWHSLKKGLDITMVCLWGLVSSFLLLYDTIGALTGVIMETFHLQFLKVAIIVALPLVEFLSVSFAWELFKEHERAGGLFKPFFSDGSEPPKQIYGADGMSGLGPKQYDGASQYGTSQRDKMTPFHTGYIPQEMHNPTDTASRKQNFACC